MRQADDGSFVTIGADANSVAADLQRIDKGLKVRFAKNTGCFHVYHEHHPGCPHNGTQGPGEKYLVRTFKGKLNSFGVWEGLDQRIVERMEYIRPGSPGRYDFAREVERQNREAEERRRKEFSEKIGPFGERAAHAARKDLGLKYKGRVFT